MRLLLSYLPVLACAGGMAVCMYMMRDKSKKGAACHEEETQARPQEAELRELNEEVNRLRAEISLLKDREGEPTS